MQEYHRAPVTSKNFVEGLPRASQAQHVHDAFIQAQELAVAP